MNRLCILDDVRLQLKPVSLRLWFTAILCLVCGVVLAVSAGAWYVVRSDYVFLNATIHEAVERNDNLMRICVRSDEQMKQKVKRNVPQNVGGEESR